MIRLGNRSFFQCAALLALLLAPNLARAIGPQYQVIGDPVPAGAGTLNDVVSLRLGNGDENGTGSVIGVSAPDANGVVRLSILTARHVATSGVVTASFGVGPGEAGAPGAGAYPLSGSLSSVFQGFTLVDPVNNPTNKPEDLAIMVARIQTPTTPAALAEFNLVTQAANNFLLAPFPTTPPAAGSSVAATDKFTELGYGTAGTFDAATNKYLAISAQPDDARRFQNNAATSVDGAAIVGNFFEPLVNWAYKAPSAAGGGASFGGDSGGPYLTGGVLATLNAKSVSVTPTFNDNSSNLNPLPPNMAITIPLSYTNYLSAVHVLGVSSKIDGSETVGDAASGVPLVETGDRTTGTLDWALYYANNPALVPEPGSFALLALGGLTALLCLRTRKSH